MIGVYNISHIKPKTCDIATEFPLQEVIKLHRNIT